MRKNIFIASPSPGLTRRLGFFCILDVSRTLRLVSAWNGSCEGYYREDEILCTQFVQVWTDCLPTLTRMFSAVVNLATCKHLSTNRFIEGFSELYAPGLEAAGLGHFK